MVTKRPPGRVMGSIQKAVAKASNAKPGPGLGITHTPFGGGLLKTSSDFLVAQSTASIAAASQDGSGNTVMGSGTILEAYPSVDDYGVVTVLTITDAPQITAYNLSGSAIDAGAWVVAIKVWGLWLIIYESCQP